MSRVRFLGTHYREEGKTHTLTHMHKHRHTHAYVRANRHMAFVHCDTHTYTYTHTHTCRHKCTQTHKYAHTPKQTRTHTHAHAQTHTCHACTCKHACGYTHDTRGEDYPSPRAWTLEGGEGGGWTEERERRAMGYSESISAHTTMTTTENSGHDAYYPGQVYAQ